MAVRRSELRPASVRKRVAESLQGLLKSRVWDDLGSRHQAMVKRIVRLADSPEIILDDPSWEMWLEEFQVVATQVREESAPVDALRHVIEKGYRRVMFSASPDIKKIRELDPHTKMLDLDGDDLDELIVDEE